MGPTIDAVIVQWPHEDQDLKALSVTSNLPTTEQMIRALKVALDALDGQRPR